MQQLDTEQGKQKDMEAQRLLSQWFIKLANSAEEHWRKLKGFNLISKVIANIRFKDGEEETSQERVAKKMENFRKRSWSETQHLTISPWRPSAEGWSF